MSREIKDLSGMRFGWLTVNALCNERASDGTLRWECLCACGNKALVLGKALKSGRSKSCGCRRAFLKRKPPIPGRLSSQLLYAETEDLDS